MKKILTNKLEAALQELEKQIPNWEMECKAVSKSNVGWHIEHSLLSITEIIKAIQQADPDTYTRTFRLPGWIVLNLRKIPRGRAKSPEVVVPKGYNEQSLREHCKRAMERIMELSSQNPDQYFHHPYLGNLKLPKAIIFLEIHTQHHINIINEIVRKGGGDLK